MLTVLLLCALAAAGYFAFRYAALIRALKQLQKDMEEIRQDLSQNQILRLPTPNRHLRELLCSLNAVLEDIRRERQSYEKREKSFRKQIENISHDLRTPLTVILGYLKLFQSSRRENLEADGDLADTIRTLEQKAETMKNLVAQFYDYSRLTASDYVLTPEKTDAARLLRESLMGSYALLEQASIHVEAELPEHPIWVLADPTALERIFQNLFQNAARYTRKDFRLSVRENDDATISFLFTNDTEKLTAEDIPHLFDRFYMQDSSRNQGGTGLGLTVARALAEEMGGTLTATMASQPASSATKQNYGTTQAFNTTQASCTTQSPDTTQVFDTTQTSCTTQRPDITQVFDTAQPSDTPQVSGTMQAFRTTQTSNATQDSDTAQTFDTMQTFGINQISNTVHTSHTTQTSGTAPGSDTTSSAAASAPLRITFDLRLKSL